MADEKDLYSVNENTGKTKNGLVIEYTGSNEQIKQSAGNQAAIKASKVIDEEARNPLPKFTLSDGKVSVTGSKDNLSHPVVTEMKKALSDAFKGKDLTDKDVAAAFQKAVSKANEQIDAQFKYEDYEDFLKSSGFSDDAYRSYSTARQEFKKTNPTNSTAMVTTYDKNGKLVSKSISEWFDYWKKEYNPEDRGQLWVKSLQASYNPTSDEDLYASIPAILMGANRGQNVVQGFFQWINPFDDKGAEAPTVTPVYGFDDTNPISVGVQSAVTEFGRILPQFLGAGDNPWLDRGADNGGDYFNINDWKDEYLENWSREDFQEWAELGHEAARGEGADTYEKMKALYGEENGRKMWMAYSLSLKGQNGVGGGKVLDTIRDGDEVVAEAGDYVGYQDYRSLWRELNSKTPAKAWDQNLQNSIEKFATYAPNAASVGVVAGQVGRIIAEQAALSLISGGALSASNIAKTLTQGGWKLVGKATGVIKAGQEIAKTSPALARAIYGLAYGSSQGLTGASRILYRLGQAGTWAVREVGEDALRGIVDDVVTRNSLDSQGNLDPNRFMENVYMNAVMGAILKAPRTVSDVAMYLLNADRNIDGLKLNGTQVSQMQDLAQAASGTADSVVKNIDEDGHPTITKGGVDQKLDQVTLTKENTDKVLPEQAPTKTLEEAVLEDESIAKKTQGTPGEVSIADDEVKEVISGQDPEAAKNLIERKLTDDEIRRKFKNGKVSINGEDYIIDVKNANLDDIVSANGSAIKDLNTGITRLVDSAKQGLRSYQEAVNGIKNHADEFATNWKNAVEKFASDNNISVRDVIIALRDLRIDGKESYPGLKALWEENWAPTANGLLDAQDSLTKIKTKRQNYYQRDMFAGVFEPGEGGDYTVNQGTIDNILGRDTTFDLTASSRKGNRQKVNDANLETDPEILAKEFVLSRLETIERYSDQGKIIATMREAISDGEELTQKEAAESLRASKKIGDDIRNSEEVKAIGDTVTEENPADNIEKLPETFGKEDMVKLDEDIKAQKAKVKDLEAQVKEAENNAVTEFEVNSREDLLQKSKGIYDKKMASINKLKDPDMKASRTKAAGMEKAARDRLITGELTGKERQAMSDRYGKLFKGKDVIVDGKAATVTNPSVYGKVKVTFEDGTTKTVEPDAVAPKYTSSEDVNNDMFNKFIKPELERQLGVKLNKAPEPSATKVVSDLEAEIKEADGVGTMRSGEPTTAVIDAYNEEAKFSAFRSKDVAAPSKKAGYKFVEDNTPIEGIKNENGSLTRWLAGSSDASDFEKRIAQVPKEIRDIANNDSNFRRLAENYQEDVAYKRVGADYPYSADRIDMSYANYLDAKKQASAPAREARINNELAAERQKLADLEARKAAIEKIEKAGDPNTEAGQKAREKTTVEVVADTTKNTAERAQDNFNKAADKSNAAREISESSKYKNRASAQANQNPIGVNYMPGNPYRGFGRWINDDFMRSQSVQINVNGKVYSAYSGGYSLFKEAPSWARMAIIDIRNGATLETAIRNVLSQNGVKIEPTDYARKKYNAPTSMEKDAEKAARIAKKITESALYGKAVKNGIVVDTELLGSMLTKELKRQGAAEFTRFLKKSKFDSFSNPQQKWLNSQAYKMIASFDPKTYKGIKANIRKAMGIVMGAKYRSNMYGNFKNAQLQLTECQRLYTLNKLGDFNKTIRRLVADQAFRDKIADAAYIYASDSLGQGLSKQDLSLYNQTLESFMKTADASTITTKGILTKLSEGAKKGTKAAIDGVDADLLSATQAAEYFKNYMLLAGIIQSAETKGITGDAANAYIRNRFNVEALAGTEIGHIGFTESSIGRLAFMYMGFPIRELALQAHIIKGGGITGGTTKLDKVAGGLLYAEKMLGAKGLVWALEAPWGYKFADVMGYDPFGVTDDRDKTADNENVDPWMRGADIAVQYMPFMRGAISSAFVDIYMAYRESYEDAKDEWLETHDSLEGFEWHLDDAPQDTIWQDALKGFAPGYTAFSRAAQEAGDLDRGYGISSTGNRMYETNTDPGSVAWGMLVGRSNTPNAMDYYQTANPIRDVQRYGLSGLGRSVERALPFRLNRSEGAQIGWRNFREFDPVDANSYSDWFDGSYADEQNWNTGYYAFREEAEEIRDAANAGLNQSNAVEKLASRESQLADLRNRVERYVQAYIAQHPEGISNYKMQQIQRIFNMEIPDAGTTFDRVLGDYSDYEKNYAENRVAQGNFPAPYGLNTPYRTQDGGVAGDYSYAQSPQLQNILQTNQYGVQSDVGRVIAQLDDQLVATPYGSMSLKDFRKKIQEDINSEYSQSKVNYDKISDLQSQYLDVFDRSIRPIFSTYGSGILDAGQASDVMQQFTSMLNGLIPSEEYRVDKKGRKIRQSTPYMRVDIKKWLQKNYGSYPAVSTTDNSSEDRLQGIRNDMDAGRTAVARAKALAFIEDLREGRTSIDRARLEELQNILRGTTGSGVTGGGNLNTGLTR